MGHRLIASAQYAFHYWFVRPILGEPSRLLYGNDARLGNNERGRRHLRQMRKAVGAGLAIQSDNQVDQLRRNGFVKVSLGYSETLLNTVCRKVCQLIDDPAHSEPVARQNVARRIVDFLHKVPECRQFVTREIHGLLQSFYGTFFRISTVKCWRIQHIPNWDGRSEFYSNSWHCDEDPIWRIKLFVNLSNVTPETGAFRLHTIESTKEIMRSGYLSRQWIIGKAKRLVEDPRRVVYADGPIGSSILCNAQLCLHRAGIPQVGHHRDIIEFTFWPAAEPLPDNWEAGE